MNKVDPDTLQQVEKVMDVDEVKRYEPYPSYKPSGVDWLDDMPDHWEPIRLKLITRINPTSSEIVGLNELDEVSFIPMESVSEYGGIKSDIFKPYKEAKQGFTYFRNGDVIIGKSLHVLKMAKVV